MEEAVGSSPTKSRRTIKEVSHLFLSSVSAENQKDRPAPLIGCYLTKGVKEETVPLKSTVTLLRSGKMPAQVCYLESSSMSLKTTSEFEIVSLSNELILELSSDEIEPLRLPQNRSEFCLFALREDDCGSLDPFFRYLDLFLVVSSFQGRDLTEVYKFIKAVRQVNSRASWFLRPFPEEAVAVSQKVGEEFNKLTIKLLNSPVHILHSGIPAAHRLWQQAVGELDPEFAKARAYILRKIFDHV